MLDEPKVDKNICPVCEYAELPNPYEPGSYDICPQCGVEFGLEMTECYPAIKSAWLEAGRPFFITSHGNHEMWEKIWSAQ